MFQQPTVAGQKLKATSGRGNGTNYKAPDGQRVKLKHTPPSVPQPEVNERRDDPYVIGTSPGEALQWMGRPANVDTRPDNLDNRTSGPTVKGRPGL